MAELLVEMGQLLRRHDHEGRMGHIDEVAVLILPVEAGQAAFRHGIVKSLQGVVLAVGIIGVPVVELERVVIVLAEIHESVHFLVGQRVLGHDGAVFVHDTGPVAGDGIIEPDAAQLLLMDDAVAAPGAEHESAARRLKLFHGLDHRRAGLRFPERHKRIVEIAGQKLILHGILP